MNDVQRTREDLHRIYQMYTGKDLSKQSIPEAQADANVDISTLIGEELKKTTALSGDVLAPVTRWSPLVQVIESKEKLVLQIELPGVAEADVDVKIDSDNLLISGRKNQDISGEQVLAINEVATGEFFRCLPLSEKINTDSLKSIFENGVLKLELAKVAD